MSLREWFSKKPTPLPTDALESAGLGRDESTQPIQPGALYAKLVGVAGAGLGSRKSARHDRREMLYAVVRDAMTRVGVLAANYKFKVLSLDSQGRQYLIMMDLARQQSLQMQRLAEVENLIARNAKDWHEILVTGVYWRFNNYVIAGLTPLPGDAAAASPPDSAAAVVTPAVQAPPPAPAPHPQSEALAQELAAFKQAAEFRASNPAAVPAPRPVHSQPVFQDTQITDAEPPLGGTQYGDLN
jgi:hypothetical protein